MQLRLHAWCRPSDRHPTSLGPLRPPMAAHASLPHPHAPYRGRVVPRQPQPQLSPSEATLRTTCAPPPPKPLHQVKYSEFQAGLRQLNVQLNRKVLSELAAQEPFSFKALVEQVKFMRGAAPGGGGDGAGGAA